MESQPQNPEFRINPENFHQCSTYLQLRQEHQDSGVLFLDSILLLHFHGKMD